MIQKLIRNKKVRLRTADGEWSYIKDPSKRLLEGDVLHVHSKTYAEEEWMSDLYETPRLVVTDKQVADLKGSVLLEHEDLFMLNKPSGLAVQGGSKQDIYLDGMLHV